jgi:hypothetical protein
VTSRLGISLFTALPIGLLDSLALGAKLRAIGQAEGSTTVQGSAARTRTAGIII